METSEFDLTEEELEQSQIADTLQSVIGKPVIASPKTQDQRIAEHRTLAADTRKLLPRQRLYLRHLLNSQMRPKIALREYNKSMDVEPLKESTVREWHRRRDFRSLVDRYTQLLLEASGVGSPAQTLLRIDAIVEDALTPVPMYHMGNALINPETGQIQKEVDRGSALKGLEMIGKASGMFRKDEEASQRVTVVLDFSGEQMQGEQESEIIDGEATEVVR